MSRRRHKRKGSDEVNLNLAAMLDMAFQLLTFFILTFKPSPIESEIALNLPPPQAVATKTPDAQTATPSGPGVAALQTLPIFVLAGPGGRVSEVKIGSSSVFQGGATPEALRALGRRLKTLFAMESKPYEQVLIRVADDVNYEELMKVIEVCSSQTLPDGTKLSKISFAPLNPQDAAK